MNNGKDKRRRRHTFPVRRQLSYDHTLYVRELYKAYILPDPTDPTDPIDPTNPINPPESIKPTEQTEPIQSTEQIEQTEQTSIIGHNCYSEEPYSYSDTGLSSPNLRPCKSSSTDSYPDIHNEMISNHKIGNKEITNHFLFGDNDINEI